MRKKAVLAMILFASLAFISAEIDSLAKEGVQIESVANSNNEFAADLYGKLAADEGNLFFSPYSISTALAMTYAGADGETAKQMSDVLHFDLAPDKLNPSLCELMKGLNAPGKSYQLSVANALWLQEGYPLQPEFVSTIKKYFGGGLQEVDYKDYSKREKARQTINKWVEDKTAGKIKELIAKDILTSLTRLVLTNAIYFKGKWMFEFKPQDTNEADFTLGDGKRVKAQLMFQKKKFKYAESQGLQILEMPYAGGDLSMVILLPSSESGLGQLEKELSIDKINEWISQLSEKEVKVFLPKYKLEIRSLLNDALISLGMEDAFDEMKANFSEMTPDPIGLYISKVIHKAFVEVNEEGTEAAAATAVVMVGKSISIDVVPVFRADHPFIFLIRDVGTGSILFMGRLADPS